MDTHETPDIQMLFKALRSFLTQLYLFSLLAEETDVAETFTIWCFEVLRRFDLIVDALCIYHRK